MHITSASISDVRVALVVLQALADVAIGHVGASAVATDARVAERWLLTLGRTPSVPDGEIDHVGHADRTAKLKLKIKLNDHHLNTSGTFGLTV